METKCIVIIGIRWFLRWQLFGLLYLSAYAGEEAEHAIIWFIISKVS